MITRFNVVWVAAYVSLCVGHLIYDYSKNYKYPDSSKWQQISDGDVALITGGSNGLGEEIVRDLLESTDIGRVIVLDVEHPHMAQVNEKVEYHECDIGNEEELNNTLTAIINHLETRHQHISILINNAAIRHSESFLNLSREKIFNVFNVNTFSQIWILKLVLSNHIERILPRDPNARLSVVFVSSILGTLGPKNLSAYSASKAAIIQIYESLLKELSEYPSVRLLLITSGQLTTKMFEDVMPSKLFFAPLVNHIKFAKNIVKSINDGEKGVICEPFYANFLPAIRVLPIFLQDFCRKMSEMDDKIKDLDNSKKEL